MTLRFVVGAATDVGRVRGHNEDAYLVDDGLGLVAVADGMGGHQAGEVASATALEALRAAVTSGEGIRDAVTLANEAVYEKSTSDERLRGMGTTLTAGTLAAGGTLLLGHVGDSRVYALRNGELRRVTTDHSLVEELIQAGELSEEEAEADPRRSMITRALGIEPDVEVDVYPTEVMSGDRLLFCSDGLTGMVSEHGIAAALTEEADPTRAAARLVDAANRAGGIDNITVLVVDVVDDDTPTATVPVVNPVDDGHPAPADPPPPEPPPATPTEKRVSRRPRRRRAWRILRWALPIVLVLGIAFFALFYYARHTYYVGTDLGNVAIYQGRPGGVLVWDATLKKRENLLVRDLPPQQRQQVRDGHGQFSSQRDAQAYVARLRKQARPSTSTTVPRSTTTSTTAPPRPT